MEPTEIDVAREHASEAEKQFWNNCPPFPALDTRQREAIERWVNYVCPPRMPSVQNPHHVLTYMIGRRDMAELLLHQVVQRS
jgi:hypothetical protein